MDHSPQDLSEHDKVEVYTDEGLLGRVTQHYLWLVFYLLRLCAATTTIQYMFLNYIFSNGWLTFDGLASVDLVGQWPKALTLGH